MGPSYIFLTSASKAKGLNVPAWPPAPEQTRISPSTPASSAFWAWRNVVTSWNTLPPQACTVDTMSFGARRLVMMRGTLCSAHTAMSSASRVLDWWIIWLIAYGAMTRSGSLSFNSANAVSICVNHSANLLCGRAFNAGMDPTMPLAHWAMTSSGPDTMNIGAEITGRTRF